MSDSRYLMLLLMGRCRSKWERWNLWNEELDKMKVQLAKEMWPGILNGARDQVTAELTEKLRAEVTFQIRTETRKRMEENGVI